MTTLMFWLKTYWYVPLVVLVGGFFFWQQTKAAPAQSQLAVSVHTTRSHASNAHGQSTTIASSRQTRSSTSRSTRGFVHIKGAVQKPGLYPVRADTRWDAVVKAAGGLTDKADISQVNLAMLAVDQESLQIPEKGGAVATAPASGTASIGGTAGQTNAAAGSRAVVNLNTADVSQLQTISGIGPKKAADIISYRDSHGGFKDVAELKEVHGIGDKTFETLAPQLTVGP